MMAMTWKVSRPIICLVGSKGGIWNSSWLRMALATGLEWVLTYISCSVNIMVQRFSCSAYWSQRSVSSCGMGLRSST